jgi:hypothetical protein
MSAMSPAERRNPGAPAARPGSTRTLTAIIFSCLVGGAIFLVTALAVAWLAIVPAVAAALTTGLMVRSILGERSAGMFARVGLCAAAVVFGTIVGAIALILALGILVIVK